MKINYRPEIDGLRAIAVFSVIIYHARDSFLPGGFLGVDIFFVISGYLITSLILKELKLTNKFSFSHFYERRVRRIIPALLGAMFFSTFISYIVALPDSFVDFSKSLIASIFSVSNFYFHYTDNLYGADSSLLKPLLHTWSLSVEEQFYILFPVTIFIFYKFFRKHLLTLIFSGILISLIFAQYQSGTNTSFNFYLLPSRGFELLLGSLLAKLELDNGRGPGSRNFSLLLSKTLPITGLSLIFYSLFFFNDQMLLPSFYSLAPIIGTMLIIWFSHKGEFITQILSNRIIVIFGLISYSLYIFHFPVFAFSRYLNLLESDLSKRILLVIFLFSISSVSYYFIERPFRNKKFISFRKLCATLIITTTSLILFNSYVIYKDGLKERLPNSLSEKLQNTEEINYNTQGTKGNVLLIGDSHANAIKYHLNEELKKESFNFSKLQTSLYVKNLNQYLFKTNKVNKKFNTENLKIEKYLNEEKNLIVVFHQRWTVRIVSTLFDNEEGVTEYKTEADNRYLKIKPTSKYINEQQRINLVRESIVSSINSMLEKNHKVILVYPVPEKAFDVFRLLHNKSINFFGSNIRNDELPIFSTNYDVYKKRNKLIFETLDSIQNDNIYRVYPHKYFCDNQIKNRCVANSKDTIYYYDNNHLSLQGSKFVVKDIVNIIKKITN